MNFFKDNIEILGPFIGLLVAIAVFLLLISLLFLVFIIIGKWKLFNKMGISGWKSIIPFYSIYVFYVELCGMHWIFPIIYIIVIFSKHLFIVGFILNASAFYNFAKRFNRQKGATMLIGAFLPNLILVIYGYSTSFVFDESIKVTRCGFFDRLIK